MRSGRQATGDRRQAAKHQRGVALITAVLIVALATILAVNVGFKAYLDQRRAATMFALDQGFEVAMGAEAWAADILKRDASNGGSKVDDFTEEWATPIPPIPVDGGEVAGQLEDMQGRFNLNSLVKVDNGELVADPAAVQRFKNLLALLELEDKWADMIVDWLDSDINPNFPDGAEDNVYTSLTPAYRPPNMRITRASELLALNEFGLERYRRLEPFVTALPPGTAINLCTAAPEVLDALLGNGVSQFTRDRKNVIEMRKLRCFPSLQDFNAQLDAKVRQEYQDGRVIDESSSYFRANVWVTIGTTQFTLYSLLNRTNGMVRPILRSFGTD
ncbi:MAG TPA: type II secretion system minor pseudopilin GspK [Povalibacter sp.]|uniref:type II secretion system minor pseudopilin GspK n=1 Tax=Povalibacter sp. TaxID=1962978 RepID=UPI002C60C157|nr:type II secretion system minor pseudopilin GspK [Povalibacter sp.]HMN43294.1 type II secretion system minor pseudopilin GspK [Povalibacter sp.]